MDPNLSLDELIKVYNIADPTKTNNKPTRYRPYRNSSANMFNTPRAHMRDFRNRTGYNSRYDRLHESEPVRSGRLGQSYPSYHEPVNYPSVPSFYHSTHSLRGAFMDEIGHNDYRPSYKFRVSVSPSPPPPPSPVHRNPMEFNMPDALVPGDGVRSGALASQPNGYKLVISNLSKTVTTADIEELFSEFGALLHAKVLRPGVAIVVYKHQSHARRAYSMYNGRSFAGQDMVLMMSSTCPADTDIVHQVLFGEKTD